MHANYIKPRGFTSPFPASMWGYFRKALDKRHFFKMKNPGGVKVDYVVQKINCYPHTLDTMYVDFLEIIIAQDPPPVDEEPMEDTPWTCPTCGMEHV